MEDFYFSSLIFNMYLNEIIMNVFLILSIIFKNSSYVDIAWPLGFTIMSIKSFLDSDGYFLRKLLINVPMIFNGSRMVIGGVFLRKYYKHEDRRWNLWRERWQAGNGWFGIKNVLVNTFFFYNAQSIFTFFLISLPISQMSNNKLEVLQFNEFIGIGIVLFGIIIENIADTQLGNFKLRLKKNKEETNRSIVCKDGLWAYSRHPNYFGEFLIWVGYSVMAYSSLTQTYHFLLLILLVLSGYYFLVCFTGIWISEQSSLKNRGKEYEEYQKTTSMLIPFL